MAVNKIKESQLPIKSTTSSDYMRVVGADGRSYRVPFSDVIEIIEEAAQSGISAEGVPSGYVPTADGDDEWQWSPQSGGGGSSLTQDVKQSLLQCFAHTAWTDDQGQDYYDDLEDALYPFDLLSSITAVYTQSGTVYDTDSLDSLKADLVVTGNYSDGTYNQNTEYTLSGTLTGGTSTITVTYGGKTTTFTVTVTASSATLTSISAAYTQSGTVVDTDSLDSLKTDLVVTATYADSTTAVIAAADYTLSGTLQEGTSVITVSYVGKTTSFNVTVTRDTTAQIVLYDKMLKYFSSTDGSNYLNYAMDKTNCAITILYDMDSATTKLYPAGILPTLDSVFAADGASAMACDDNGARVSHVNEYNRWAQIATGTMSEYSQEWTLTKTYTKIAFCLDKRYIDDSYMYDKTTGKVWFAGINTPYYGMSNISEAE